MKKLFILMLSVVLLSACASNFSRVQNYFNPNKYGRVVYYDSIKKGEVVTYYIYDFFGESGGMGERGWYCWDYDVAKDGTIIRKAEYWIGYTPQFKLFRERHGFTGEPAMFTKVNGQEAIEGTKKIEQLKTTPNPPTVVAAPAEEKKSEEVKPYKGDLCHHPDGSLIEENAWCREHGW